MILPLVYYGSKLLRTKCAPILEITDEIKKLASDMVETMDVSRGIGLAAPQVGHLVRLFVLRNYIEVSEEELTLSDPLVYINPKLIAHTPQKILDSEGCLSIPGIRGEVERPLKITIEAMDLEGRVFVEELEGYNARVRLHELDHLNGVLFIDRMALRPRKKMEPFLKELEKKHQSL